MDATNDKIVTQFNSWTLLKIQLHITPPRDVYFREKEIWWASLGCNIGFEQDGKHNRFERPILVLKKFNKHVLWSVPLTSQNKTGRYYRNIEYKGKRSTIILSQLRLISSKRLLRKIGVLSKEQFEEVKQIVKSFL